MSEKKKTIVKEEVYVALNFSFSREIVEKKNNETRSFIFIHRLESFSIRRQISRFTISFFVYETSRIFNYELRERIYFREENSREEREREKRTLPSLSA